MKNILSNLCRMTAMSGVVSGCALSHQVPSPEADRPSVERTDRFTIGENEGGSRYVEAEGGPYGLNALELSEDGSFWVQNATSNEVLHFDPQGHLLGRIDTSEGVMFGRDILPLGDSLFVLDVHPNRPALVEYEAQGKLKRTIEYPELWTHSVVGLATNDKEEVQLHFGSSLVATLTESGRFGPQHDYAYAGHTIQTRIADRTLENPGRKLRLRVDRERVVDHEVADPVGGIQLLRVLDDGSYFLRVEEFVFSPYIEADQTIWHLSADGKVLGKARVPLDEFYSHVEYPVAITDEGELYLLVTHERGSEVRKLALQPSLEHILPAPFSRVEEALAEDARLREEHEKDAEEPATEGRRLVNKAILSECRYAADMYTTGEDYHYFFWTPNATNLTGACTDRRVNTFVNSMRAGVRTMGIPYDWGHTTTLAGFQDAMTRNNKAGNVNTSVLALSCSSGTDCAGFVSRAWDLRNSNGSILRMGTGRIPEISTLLGKEGVTSLNANLALGYVANKAGSKTVSGHVAMFVAFPMEGADCQWMEASGTAGRQLWWSKAMSTRSSGYLPRRYVNHCDGGW